MKTLLIAVLLLLPFSLTAQDEPRLTEMEQLRLENLQLKYTLLNIERDRVQQLIQAGHPGYTFDITTGVFTKAAPIGRRDPGLW